MDGTGLCPNHDKVGELKKKKILSARLSVNGDNQRVAPPAVTPRRDDGSTFNNVC